MQYRNGIVIIAALIAILTGCKTPQQAIDGKTAYALKQYSTATELLQKEFEAEKDPAKKKEKANQIADAYRQYNNTAGAAEWYKKAADLGDEQALYKLGQMQMMNELYDEAIKTFNKFGNIDIAIYSTAQVIVTAYQYTTDADIMLCSRGMFKCSLQLFGGEYFRSWTSQNYNCKLISTQKFQ